MHRVLKHFLPLLLTAVLGVGSLLVSAVTLYVLCVSHWHGPFRDMWEIYPFLEKIIQHSWGWRDLWESYGYAHRLFIPRLLFIADYQFANATNHFLIAISLLCQLGIVTLFAKRLFAKYLLSFWQAGCLFFLVIIFQFSGTLLFNFLHTFDVQWFLCCFFVSAAFYMLTADHSIRHEYLLAISGILIVLACLNNVSAMAAWPVWGIFLYARISSMASRWILLLSAGVFIIAYGADVKASATSFFFTENIISVIVYFLLKFPLLYLANPVSNPDYLSLGMWGMVLVAIPVLLLTRFF